MNIKRVDPNTPITARKMNELIDAMNLVLNTSGGRGVNVQRTNGGLALTTTPSQETLNSCIEVRCKNIGETQIRQFYACPVIATLRGPTDARYTRDLILTTRNTAFESDADRVFGVAQETVNPGCIGRFAISGITPVYVYGAGTHISVPGGLKYDGVYPFAIRPGEPGGQIIAAASGLTVPYLGIVLLGARTETTEDEPDEPTLLDVVATLPPIPDEEHTERRVFWGDATVIEGGTGDNQIWSATWKDTRWYPSRPTTKTGTPGA